MGRLDVRLPPHRSLQGPCFLRLVSRLVPASGAFSGLPPIPLVRSVCLSAEAAPQPCRGSGDQEERVLSLSSSFSKLFHMVSFFAFPLKF